MRNENPEKENQLKQETEKFSVLPEKSVEFNEDWSVTFPEVTLSNPLESLSYVREQEKAIISKLRESRDSNEYVINEVKEMLEDAFNWWYHSDNSRPKEKRPGEKSAVCSDCDYEWDKKYYVDWPIKFLSEYEGSLQKFMDLIAEELKNREYWWWDSLYVMCDRFWITVEEFKNMDTTSIIEMVKKDIKNIPSLNPSTCRNNMWEHLWVASFYLSAICWASEKLWYKGY